MKHQPIWNQKHTQKEKEILIQKIKSAIECGTNMGDAARSFGIDPATYRAWIKQGVK